MKFAFLMALAAFAFHAGTASAKCDPNRDYPLRLKVSRADQLMFVYERGKAPHAFEVSTGRQGFETPDFSGGIQRVETRWDSSIYPQGDYKGLGNMPYAMFFQGGYAIHGTPVGNFTKLGKPASHCCVRMYPEQAKILNDAVKAYGMKNVCLEIGEFPTERGVEEAQANPAQFVVPEEAEALREGELY